MYTFHSSNEIQKNLEMQTMDNHNHNNNHNNNHEIHARAITIVVPTHACMI